MDPFSPDHMLLPSINHLLDNVDSEVKCGSAPAQGFSQSPLADEEMTLGCATSGSVLHPECCTRPAPKMLTPPDSPVFSELTTPTYLLKMAPHDEAQLVPDLVHGISENALYMSNNIIDMLETDNFAIKDMLKSLSPNSDEMFDSDGSEWPGIYIDDLEDNNVPSPTPSHPFDAPALYDLDTSHVDAAIPYQDHARVDRIKHESVSTDSLISDSGSEMGSCPSPIFESKPFRPHHYSSSKSKSKRSDPRTHNYKRRVSVKSLTELKEEGSSLLKPPGSLSPKSTSSTSSSLSSSSSSSSLSSLAESTDRVPRRRGRPRKRLSGDLGERDGAGRRKSGRKTVKGSHLWEFILQTLRNKAYCPQYIKWEDKEEGVFRIVNSKMVASMWGEIKNNPRMTYEKLSRAMRYYYKRQILERVDKARLVYKFGEKAEGWNQVEPEV